MNFTASKSVMSAIVMSFPITNPVGESVSIASIGFRNLGKVF